MLSHQNSRASRAHLSPSIDFQPFLASLSLSRSLYGEKISQSLVQSDQSSVNHVCGYFIPPTKPHLTLPSFWSFWDTRTRSAQVLGYSASEMRSLR